ncbi:MAG: putative bifunctional diguanylate cyclase/phosphodiesterase [Acidimicrobiales bacterium]
MPPRSPRPDAALPFPDMGPEVVIDLRADAVLAHVSDLVAVVGSDGTLLAVSASVEQRLGHRRGGLVGSPVSSLFVADPDDVPAEVLDRIFLEPGAHGPITLSAMTADGRSRTVEAMIDNQLGPDGEGSVVVTAVDLTERRMLDAAMAEQRSLLESIARGVSVDRVADRLVERIEHWLPDAVAAVLLTDVGGIWQVVAAPSVPETVVEVLDRASPSSPVGKAIGRLPDCTTVVSAMDPNWFPMRTACRSAGVESLWVRPFHVLGRSEPVGAIVVVRTDHRVLDEGELDLIEQSSHLAAIAVERQLATEALEHRALHDDLTGLPNRTLLLDRVEQALNRASRDRSGVAVLFVDLDRFKHINDTLGHAAGDAVLCEVAGRLQGVLRAGDTVGRLGGDEFLMVCSEIADVTDALTVADRVWDVLQAPVSFQGHDLPMRASVGVAIAEGPETTADEVIRDADHAMYRAKENGRNGVALFDRDDHERVVSRVDIERGLHGAHDRGELVLHFQPVLQLADHRQTSVEALVRWERPGAGIVGPNEFISIAEDTGLIVPLGAWVIEEAFRSAVAWPELDRGTHMRVAVNLSPRQLSTPGLVDRVTRLFDRTGIDPGRICFEVTELALARDEDLAIATLNRLKGLGVCISIDDFGTGYATLDYLRRFTMADELKIDQRFVAGLGDPLSQEHAIVAASVNLAHSLGIEVVAEGIETEAQLAAAIDLGCDQGQGYLLGCPEHFVAAVATSTAHPATNRSG